MVTNSSTIVNSSISISSSITNRIAYAFESRTHPNPISIHHRSLMHHHRSDRPTPLLHHLQISAINPSSPEYLSYYISNEEEIEIKNEEVKKLKPLDKRNDTISECNISTIDSFLVENLSSDISNEEEIKITNEETKDLKPSDERSHIIGEDNEQVNTTTHKNQSPECNISHYNNHNNSANTNTKKLQNNKIFVGGLSLDITKKKFSDYFMRFGTIVDIVIIHNKESGISRGFGFVTYESHEAVDCVLQNRYHVLDHKEVEVKIAVPKEPIRFDLSNPHVSMKFDPPCVLHPLPSVVSYSNFGAHFHGQCEVTPYSVAPYRNYGVLVSAQYQVPPYNMCVMNGGSIIYGYGAGYQYQVPPYNVCAVNGGSVIYGYGAGYYNRSIVQIGEGISGGYGSYGHGTGYYDISNM